MFDFLVFSSLPRIMRYWWRRCFHLGWGVGGDEWKWWCQLFAWEEELVGECSGMLSNVVLQADTEEKWQ